jgi:ubiquitin carboxyl-terminal hydrolase 34
MCCYRDLKNFERFNFVIHSLIYLVVSKLKNIKELIQNTNAFIDKNLKSNIEGSEDSETPKEKEKPAEQPAAVEEPKKSEESSETVAEPQEPSTSQENPAKSEASPEEPKEEIWILPELEKLLIFISKIFLLNFPLYIAYKHGVHGSRIDDITQQEVQTLSMFCDIHDTEIPVFLYRNVTLFCTSGGFGAMAHCFELLDLPVSTAHACTVAISNIKLWLNYRSIIQLFVPLRIKVLQYMCKLSDQDLRSPATKSMADFMWTAIKDPLDSHITFDTEGLALAFKYFTSSTLTMRLAGMSQINAHINLFNDICTTETVAEVEIVGRKLADWLTENQIISHLFGPNLHVEVIKQSHIVLNFLAVENQITEEHVTMMWQAAQLKHCSKQVYDILPSLVKNLAPKPAAHLYSLLCRLDPKEHTEQSIYIVSALTKLIWARDRSRQLSANDISSNIQEMPSSSENSVSADGTNSDEEHQDEDSSDCRKSPSSDTAPPPCKQARHVAILNKKRFTEEPDDVKVEPDIYEMDKEKRIVYPILGHHIAAFNEGTSSDECMMEVNDNLAGRKKFRKKRKKILTRKEIQDMVESISDGDSHSDPLFGGSDCSESHMREEVLERLNKDESFFRAIADGQLMDFLQAAENDGSSSPMSNKSEKNMADFDDEESPCEEELAQLTASAHCMPQFSLPRPRSNINRSSTPSNGKKSHKNSSGGSSNEKVKSNSSNVSSSPLRSPPEICQPGSTLLWDLLQDEKIVSIFP